MKRVAFFIAATLLAVCHAYATIPSSRDFAPFDTNSNRIEDSLERVTQYARPEEKIRVIVMLNVLPLDPLLQSFEAHGGKVTHRFTRSIYGFSGSIPARNIFDVAREIGSRLVFIEIDKKGIAHIDNSARIIRTRPTVWRTFDTQGDPSVTIGILDTGIDDSHTDLAGKLTFWADLTSESRPSGV